MKGDLCEMHSKRVRKIQACSALTLAGLSLSAALAGAGPASALMPAVTAPGAGDEQYRPAVHFTPKAKLDE
jgi:levanase